ncbi:MAG: hypothetical protein KDB21_07615, partial [Acidimicrobiales bacterium]|nr:hypothetical protein [Acidimicrobiales bacterium]
VVGTLPITKGADGGVDLGATMAAVPALAEAGVTDFRAYLPLSDDPAEAEDQLSPVVAAFRQAVGRA